MYMFERKNASTQGLILSWVIHEKIILIIHQALIPEGSVLITEYRVCSRFQISKLT